MKINESYYISFLTGLLFISLSSCLSHYQQNIQFYKNYETGKYKAAEKVLLHNKKASRQRNKLLYHLNLGMVYAMQGEYKTSNQHFEEAYFLGEDYRKNYLNEVASFLTNPTVTEYKGEDVELLLIHYYKALNFLKMGENQKALVECKRMQIKLNTLSDKYTSDKKYQRDAFIHTLMGIIYEANLDVNNAFIAYRNAVEIYQEDYKEMFGIDVPNQLKQDVMRTAHQIGFHEELRRFEEEFGQKYYPSAVGEGDLVFFWHNGLGPIKSEFSINFLISRRGTNVYFVNEEFNLYFDFPIPLRKDNNDKEYDPLGSLSSMRVAFPKYIERPTFYQSAELTWQNQTKPIELVENINDISRKVLRERLVKELSKGLVRLAIKKAQEITLRSNDKDRLASLLSFVNSATEKADTRAWQTLPHSISYTRLRLPAGSQTVKMQAQTVRNSREFEFTFDIPRNGTVFHTFHSLEIDPNFQHYSMNYR
jgi:hypothetical protein